MGRGERFDRIVSRPNEFAERRALPCPLPSAPGPKPRLQWSQALVAQGARLRIPLWAWATGRGGQGPRAGPMRRQRAQAWASLGQPGPRLVWARETAGCREVRRPEGPKAQIRLDGVSARLAAASRG